MAALGFMKTTVVKNFRDATLTISDGTPITPITLTVLLREGNFSYEEKRNAIVIKDLGILSHMRAGDEETLSFSVTARYVGLHASGTNPSIYEILLQKGRCAAGGDKATTSTTAATGDVYTVDLILKYTDIDGTNETLTFEDAAVLSCKFDEGEEANTLAFSGIAQKVSPTITGSAS